MQGEGPRYPSGEPVHAGDRVRIAGKAATVVFVVTRKEYAPGFPSSDWGFVESGLGVLPDDGEVIVYDALCEDDAVELVARA